MTNDVLNATPSLARARQMAAQHRIEHIRALVESNNQKLLEHRYFRLCAEKLITREQMLDIAKQLYCFSVFFERLLARRITEYSSNKNPYILALAREHMREEIGHAELFRACLEANGVSADEVLAISPAMFTKAIFGYLTVTIQHESELVSNVAIMQVMESIGYHFFSATMVLMQSHGMLAQAMAEHSEADIGHSNLGIELIGDFDDVTMNDCCRTIADIYRLMPLVIDEWLGSNTLFASASSVSGVMSAVSGRVVVEGEASAG
jgi:pyrroloquinoline quinone (PQQ) biosynthesis protein C